MTLHLIKLSVGSEDVESLRRWQAGRLAQCGRLFHRTRMRPRREHELLDGGSIYWVIRGRIQARQRLLGLDSEPDEAGRRYTLLLLDPQLVRTVPRPHRAFQGWRYLAPADAPADVGDREGDAAEAPPEMLAELRALGLL